PRWTPETQLVSKGSTHSRIGGGFRGGLHRRSSFSPTVEVPRWPAVLTRDGRSNAGGQGSGDHLSRQCQTRRRGSAHGVRYTGTAYDEGASPLGSRAVEVSTCSERKTSSSPWYSVRSSSARSGSPRLRVRSASRCRSSRRAWRVWRTRKRPSQRPRRQRSRRERG